MAPLARLQCACQRRASLAVLEAPSGAHFSKSGAVNPTRKTPSQYADRRTDPWWLPSGLSSERICWPKPWRAVLSGVHPNASQLKHNNASRVRAPKGQPRRVSVSQRGIPPTVEFRCGSRHFLGPRIVYFPLKSNSPREKLRYFYWE
ncbi:hypothetical protein PGT21_024785 [Puccinia graminis f. sp. tritici]|uniref:Uncharacterized protein n=1 Tax=Puccinia graminis f. sp. tritici TaxID=56615 RepID=A0A5B0MDG5_PUCGR|nr:hypothetical protein PGT21_024785 [Puccinia graminis f. sp. tritici]